MSEQDEIKTGGSTNRASRKPGELYFIVLLIIVSAAALREAYGIAGFSKWSSPGVFPMLAAGTMLLSALFILKDSFAGLANTEHPENLPLLPKQVALTAAYVVLYVLLMPLLGFLIASSLFLFASLLTLWKKPVWQAALVTFVSLIAIHFIFRIVFQVILPRGTVVESLL